VSGFAIRRFKCTGSKSSSDSRLPARTARGFQLEGKTLRPAEETLKLLRGRTFDEIAQIRQRTSAPSSPWSLTSSNEAKRIPARLLARTLQPNRRGCHKLGMDRLKPLKEALAPKFLTKNPPVIARSDRKYLQRCLTRLSEELARLGDCTEHDSFRRRMTLPLPTNTPSGFKRGQQPLL